MIHEKINLLNQIFTVYFSGKTSDHSFLRTVDNFYDADLFIAFLLMIRKRLIKAFFSHFYHSQDRKVWKFEYSEVK